ncbi:MULTISPECIES: hypothetical protein [unclassified Aureimonas]|uniref:hypothetical protein n=1 Tax=unclassified Aureimonas TaxID=2615206 RepID=UPI0006F8D04E|nr:MULTISPECIES: hypothetical protein [unclassified Aureimonas]KQT52798.1 hypothetical protein ASG62_12790 [Aureimonas sp. Leaf427]KQT80257.1 hypothetical protein ASG54_06640 [Aureimonas sp. Leaf460]
MSVSQGYTLRGQIRALETTTHVTLAVLALASGVFTYLGVRELLDGSATTVFFGAVIYSTSVSVAIYAFWSYLLRFMPHVRQAGSRRMLYVAMAMGACFIMAMSSWLNASALAGSAALEQHLANTTEDYQERFNAAHENALASQSLLPDLQLASQRFAGLADIERQSGALTGTSGSGTVVQLLSQMSTQLSGLQAEVEGSRTAVETIFAEGSKRLSTMRELVSSGGPVAERSNAYAEEAVQLSGLIAGLQQTSVAPAVKRAAADLGQTFIAPVADGTDAELQTRQSEVVGKVEAAVKAQSVALGAAADEILARPVIEPVRFTPLSAPEAVIRYARDFLPSWAGAIAIDLVPGVLIFILCIVQEVIRREEGDEMGEVEMSTAELMRALRIQQKLRLAEEGRGEIVIGEAEDDIVQRNDPVAPFPKTVHR